jgi:hypothetical protein
MKLPFGLPRSTRLLDVTMPAGSTANFTPVPPPPGVPAAAQLSNVATDFGWEYVWHCHLLGHEENDMMRPIVLDVPVTVPTAPRLTVGPTAPFTLTWTDPTPFDYTTGLPASTLGNPMNEIGFQIMRGTGNAGAMTQIGTAIANQTNFTDTTALANQTYRYQVVVYNAAGSTPSNLQRVTPPPAAPTNVRVTAARISNNNDRITLTWTVPAGNNQTGFTIQMSTNPAFPTGTATATATVTATTITWTSGNVPRNTAYYLRIQATNGGGASAWVNGTPSPITTP